MINLDKKYIFTHIEKTGGTSVSSEIMRHDIKGMYFINVDFSSYSNGEVRLTDVEEIKLSPFTEISNDYANKHTSLLTFKCFMPEEEWNRYYKFAFVRHPIYRIVSLYLHQLKSALKIDAPPEEILKQKYIPVRFNENVPMCTKPGDEYTIKKGNHDFTLEFFIKKVLVPGGLSQIYQVTNENNRLLPDFIGKFENLQEDYDKVCDHIKIPKTKLPHLNSGGGNNEIYEKFYTDDLKQFVYEQYKEEFELFGYDHI